MFSSGSYADRIRRHVQSQRWAVVVGVIVLVAGVATGVAAGAPALFGVLGGLVVLVAFALLAWRNRRGYGPGASTLAASLAVFAVAALVTLVVIQLVPYGRDHSNPPVTGEPAWASPRTRELMVNACYGCHSNEVEWPWYSSVAPISWVVTSHVDEGRDEVNYSEFATDRGEAEETIEVIREGSMPPGYYTLFDLHPEARLSDAEIEELVSGLRQTPGMVEEDDD